MTNPWREDLQVPVPRKVRWFNGELLSLVDGRVPDWRQMEQGMDHDRSLGVPDHGTPILSGWNSIHSLRAFPDLPAV